MLFFTNQPQNKPHLKTKQIEIKNTFFLYFNACCLQLYAGAKTYSRHL